MATSLRERIDAVSAEITDLISQTHIAHDRFWREGRRREDWDEYQRVFNEQGAAWERYYALTGGRTYGLPVE